MTRSILRSGDEVERSSTYHLLARLWLKEVDRNLLDHLGSPPLRDAFTAAGGCLAASGH